MSAVETRSRARLAGALALAERSERFSDLAARIEAREQVQVTEANGGARAFAWAATVARLGRTLLLVAPSEERARRWRAELAGWLGEDEVLAFPERESMPFEASSPSQGAVHQRLTALWRLRDGRPIAVVAPLRSLLQHTIPPDVLAASARVLRPGDKLPWRETALWLTGIGYEPVPEVSEPGHFSRRGGIVDVHPSGAEMPVRLELFGDDVETIRAFDPVTQRSQDPLESVTVLPAREISLDAGPELAERLADLGWDRLASHEELAPYGEIVEPLRQRSYVPGVEAFAAQLGATASLLDHLPDRATVVLEDTVELDLAWDTHEQLAEERREELQQQGLPVGAFPAPYIGRDRVEGAAAERGSVRIGPGRGAVALGWGSVTSYAGRLDTFLREVAGSGADTRIIATPQAARVADLLGEREVFVTPREELAEPPADGELVLLHVPLAEGFALPDLGVRVFTDAEIFGFRKPRHPVRRRRRVAIGTLLSDLKPGDHVVHEDRGIALFERFTEKEVVGVLREYLELRFADGLTSLPTERIDKITRYIGGTPPALSAMGGSDWLRTKRKAKKAAEDIARELLRLYAERETVQAAALSPDSPWQVELENAFPFTETPDQLQAIEDTKRDLEKPRPMDRLVVGDVG
ncbi:MAG TPA: CarD family transcriptional regulator, partial [Candidatus Limnocylindrales bacterium]|nr:CarD family transcriptional regulator [Candidatus Limnocylindrales bacterium]